MRPFVLGLTLALGTLLASLPSAALAQGKPKYRVAEKVEAQAGDGRWYVATVQRVKKPDEYLIYMEGFPKGSDTWFKEDKLRPTGGGEVVPVEYVRANFAVREKLAAYDAHWKQQSWGSPSWQEGVDRQLKEVGELVEQVAQKWPEEKMVPAMREGVERRRSELAAKRAEGAGAAAGAEAEAAKQAEAATALEAHYKPIYEQARNIPFEVRAEDMVDRAELLEAMDLAAIAARVAADKQAFPEVFKYYGMQQKDRYADLEWGGQKRPTFAHKALEQVCTYYLPAIYEAKAKLTGKEAELARAVSLALEAARTVEDAQKAGRLARAVKTCQPAAPQIEELIARCAKREQEIASAPPPSKPAPVKPSAPTAPTRKALDPKQVDSGVELFFSTKAAPDSPPATSFGPGDFIYAHARFKGPITKVLANPVVSDTVAFPLYLYDDQSGAELDMPFLGVRSIHLFNESSAGGKGYLVIPIVSNPAEDCYVYANNTFNRSSWEKLAELPPGKHVIEARLESSAAKVDGIPLAVAKLEITISPEGNAKWKQNAPAVFDAIAQRGGEIVDLGLRAEGPGGWKIVCHEGRVSTGQRGGRFSGNDFVIGIWKAGQKASDHYTPEGGVSLFVKRGEGGFQVLKQGKVLATFKHDQTILDRDGKAWGKVTNEWEKVTGVGDLLPMVAGLHHFSDLLR